jgi:hypothetical protein
MCSKVLATPSRDRRSSAQVTTKKNWRRDTAVKLFAVRVLAGDVVDIFVDDLPAVGGAEVAQLGKLVLGILALSPGNAVVNGGAAGAWHTSILLQDFTPTGKLCLQRARTGKTETFVKHVWDGCADVWMRGTA